MKFKTIFAANLALAVLAILATPASAQTYGTVTAYTNACTIAGSTASNTPSVFDIRNNRNITVQLKFAGDAAGTANVTAAFIPSLDGTTFDTVKTYTIAAPANGAGNAVIAVTNWDFGAYGFLKAAYVTNAAGSGNITNVSLTVGLKPGQ